MVTSTSTPGSMEMEVICLTTSAGLCRSIRRLWMRSSKRSHVLVPGSGAREAHSTEEEGCAGSRAAAKALNLMLRRLLSSCAGVGRARTLAARRLAGGDAEHLGGHAHGALHLEALLLSPADQVRAHCHARPHLSARARHSAGAVAVRTLLQVGHVLGGERDADAVHAHSLLTRSLALALGRLVGSGHLEDA